MSLIRTVQLKALDPTHTTSVIRLSNEDHNSLPPLTSTNQNTSNDSEGDQVSTDLPAINVDQPHTDVYLYSHGGESKFSLLCHLCRKCEQVKSEVNIYL